TRKGKLSKKIQIRVKAPVRLFNPDDRATAMVMAAAVAETIGANLANGKAPDGGTLPGLSGSTRKRRQVEEAQGKRGGQAHPKFKDGAYRAKVERNWQKDYTPKGAKLRKRGTFTPIASGPRGMLSGLLAGSVVARASSDGKGFLVFVAAQRGKPRRGELESALESTLAGGRMWNARASLQPAMELARLKAMREMSVVGRAALARQIVSAAKQLRSTLAEAGDLSGN
ncbi:MAG: hypothetical protein ACTSX8_08500, partial [Alphaproteobacteria bacterium]